MWGSRTSTCVEGRHVIYIAPREYGKRSSACAGACASACACARTRARECASWDAPVGAQSNDRAQLRRGRTVALCMLLLIVSSQAFFSYQVYHMLCCPSRDRRIFHTRITTCYAVRVSRQAHISYQDYHMLLLPPQAPTTRAMLQAGVPLTSTQVQLSLLDRRVRSSGACATTCHRW